MDKMRTRSGENDQFKTRKITVSAKAAEGQPLTLNEAERSVVIGIASETDQVRAYDYDMGGYVPEILVMSGFVPPESGQVPLLDAHGRYSVDDVFGSVKDYVVSGDTLDGTAFYSETERANNAFVKTKEGHLTDYSAGFRVLKEMKLQEDQTTEIEGRTYTGPCILITKWALKEVSTCPIGADPTAKARGAAADNKRSPDGSGKENNQATPPAEPQTKEKTVDPKIRAFLERSGLSTDATEAEAYAFMERMEVKKPDSQTPEDNDGDQGRSVDAGKIRSDELNRVRSITAMCTKHDCVDLADGMIDGNKTVDEARAAVLSHIETRGQSADENLPGFRAEVGVEGRDKFRAAAQDSLIVRAGMVQDNYAPGHDELRGYSLTELSRQCLRAAGRNANGDPMDVVGRALTTSDLPIILGNTANISMAEGYETAEETWSEFCAEGSVSDFKQHTIARASEADDLDEILEDGEYKHGDMSESKEAYKIGTFGKKFGISRVAIINDDMDALTDTPKKYGEAAARKIGDIVYAVINANSAMGDGTALFHADHGNLGSAAVIGMVPMGAGIKAMRLQKDLKGKRSLNIRPQFFLAPASIEAAAEVFFSSENFDATNKGATRNNIYAGSKYKRIYEARLDDVSETAYYLLGPKGKTIKVFFLHGNKTPYLETRNGWDRDGIEYKVRLDAVAKALDWKTMHKNPG